MVSVDTIQEHIQALASQNSSESTAIDVYRLIREQADLLYQTECVRENLAVDPFQALSGIDRNAFGKRVQVVDYDCVRTRQDFVNIHAQVTIETSAMKNGKRKNLSQPRLSFVFEREPSGEGGTILTYAIDFAMGPSQPKEKLLWVQVVAVGNHPSLTPARDMGNADGDDDDADWSDIDSAEEGDDDDDAHGDGNGDGGEHNNKEAAEQSRKRAKTTSEDNIADIDPKSRKAETAENNRPDDDADKFIAGMDPDVLAEFIKATSYSMDEATAFFLLMSFPFYEMEWDLVGFVLESVFGSEESDGEDEDGDE